MPERREGERETIQHLRDYTYFTFFFMQIVCIHIQIFMRTNPFYLLCEQYFISIYARDAACPYFFLFFLARPSVRPFGVCLALTVSLSLHSELYNFFRFPFRCSRCSLVGLVGCDATPKIDLIVFGIGKKITENSCSSELSVLMREEIELTGVEHLVSNEFLIASNAYFMTSNALGS